MLHYVQQTKNTGSAMNPVRQVIYWQFDNKQQRDLAIGCCPATYPATKKTIPDSAIVKKFDSFIESYSGLFLIMVEK